MPWHGSLSMQLLDPQRLSNSSPGGELQSRPLHPVRSPNARLCQLGPLTAVGASWSTNPSDITGGAAAAGQFAGSRTAAAGQAVEAAGLRPFKRAEPHFCGGSGRARLPVWLDAEPLGSAAEAASRVQALGHRRQRLVAPGRPDQSHPKWQHRPDVARVAQVRRPPRHLACVH